MSNLPSQQTEAPTCEALSDDELQAVSGGVAFAIGRAAQGGALVTGKVVNPGLIGGIKLIGCVTCRSGIPLDLTKNSVINPVLNSPLSRF
jgi:bacteriocin-like protein